MDEEEIDDIDVQDHDHDFLIDAAVLAILNDENEENDDDEDGPRTQRVYVDIEGWRRLEGVSFRLHFRMRRGTFQKLLLAVGHRLRRQGRLRWLQTPLDLCLLYTVWVIFNPDTFRSIGCNFGVASSTIFHHYSYLISTICELSSDYIKWPGPAERMYISLQFERRYGYSGVAGCIDGTFFEITAPLGQKIPFLTRHHTYTFMCQAVCDHNLLIRDVYLGEAGSVGDRRMFANSPLFQMLLRCPNALAEDEHLLGDCAYPLSKHLLTPYINDGNLSPARRLHNYQLSRVRASIERAFALLFGKMTRSKHHRTYSWPITMDHAMAAIVIHNFIIVNEVIDAEDNFFEDAVPLRGLIDGPEEELTAESALIGALKREYMCALLNAAP